MATALSGQGLDLSKPDPKGAMDFTESPIKPEISGFVRYPPGRPNDAPVMVKLQTPNGRILQEAWTGNLGEFSFPQIACGDYILAVDAPGFRPIRVAVEHSYIPAGTIFLKLVPAAKDDAANADDLAAPELRVPPPAKREYEKGLSELGLKRTDEGIQHFRKAIALFADYDLAYLQLGWAYLQQRNYADAQKVLEQAVRRNDNVAGAHVLLGSVQKAQNHFPEAVQQYERSLRLDEASWLAHLGLGEVLMKLGKNVQAYPHLVRAHELGASRASTHLQLYNSLILRSDYPAALAELDDFLKLFPQHALAPRARQQREVVLAKLQSPAK